MELKIGFIGLGVMGKPMAEHIKNAGHELYVYIRTKEKCLDLLEKGAIWCNDVAECARCSDVMVTMIGFPKDVEEVYFGKDGVIENMKEGSIMIDMTTTSPKLSQRIYEEAQKRGLHSLDAPVSGGDKGAKEATLAIMVGGDQEIFEKMKPLLSVMGTNVIYEGEAGAGQHTKMANQIAIAGTLAGTVEAIAYGKKAGLDVQKMLDTIANGAAGSWQLSNLGQKIIDGDFNPGFFIKHFVKDMRIADEEALSRDLTLEVLEKVLSMETKMQEEGYDEEGTQGLAHYYENI
jgi:3-hydroxyisobutyrate dehydrogenase/2-hydroxy-3-oxopropionate reductase